MKNLNYFYVLMFGYAGFSAEEITIVRATNKKHLKNLGFGSNKDTDIIRFDSLEGAETWVLENNEGYPKSRIKYWV
ncbi:MAG TPA: hypothetical protein VGB37_08590 [Candidatus Lokiarchaeia archaeon]